MRQFQTEYLLKGIFLGLLLFVALQAPNWTQTGEVALWMLGGLLGGMVLAGVRQIRQGFRITSNVFAFVFFLLLENSFLIYAGILFGLASGALSIRRDPDDSSMLLTCVLGGAILGVLLGQLRSIRSPMYRMIAGLLGPAVIVTLAVLWLQRNDFFQVDKHMLGWHLLLGLPFFYLLTFTGVEEESEVEIAALCVTLGLALFLMAPEDRVPAPAFLVPVILYFVYATRILPGLRVFKHTLRGFSYLEMNRIRQALLSFRRALQLDPQNQLANSGMWKLHRCIDIDKLSDDPETLELIDLDLCLNRVHMLLCGDRPPNAEQMDEARRLLDLVQRQAPPLRAQVDYYRVVLWLHRKDYDAAAELLERLLNPSVWSAEDPYRRAILFSAWRLALYLHPEMRRRVGPQIDWEGRRMEAIAAVERQLAESPNDPVAQEMKLMLYNQLQEQEYQKWAASRDGIVPDFNHDYVEQLGLALIDDPARWQRGAEYLRIAARGLSHRGPSIFNKLAEAAAKAGDREAQRNYLEQVKRAGLAYDPRRLDEEQRAIFYGVVKRLADEAAAAEDYDAAIADYSLHTQYERSGKETLRALAEVYAKKKDPLQALRVTEKALLYDAKDKDLLAKKDSYYYSVTPEQLKEVLDEVRSYFDVNYCIRKAKQILDNKEVDLDLLDWAQHLIELACLFQPKNLAVMVLAARVHLRRGERDAALQLLEDVREAKPSDSEEEEARYWACQNLGRMYLDELNRPDLAIGALLDFKKSTKSGADTIYHLGRAYEATNDIPRAIRCFEQVTAYEDHPRAYDAREALRRLKPNAE